MTILDRPQGSVPSLYQQQLMQQVRSPSPNAAQLAQAVHSPQPIASPRTQNQPIPSPKQQLSSLPHYSAQSQSSHPSLSVETTGLTGPDHMNSNNDVVLIRLSNPMSSHPNISNRLRRPVNQEQGLPSRDNMDLTHLA